MQYVDLGFMTALVLPAYGGGLIWLVKVAREDPQLYKLLEPRLHVQAVTLFLISLLVTVALLFLSEIPSQAKKEFLLLGVIWICLSGHAVMSRRFFRAVLKLPPKGNPK
ncbi:hypothetical protein [Kerstersia gyiorum]|uniref:hypothetical protein n=1 Tax=Kerstersia gyiorum TaxID=206506 RepID=UPI00209E1A0D|nr:hypothetical protein [Kerstersia gyiorum]MCP1679431.1 hypothetical protein [Kerstersia gyiorum]MCP1823934.1 hypothetical protein [Kerstersia gyiorum]MCP1827375.1 hypothetical protein [Kerstersia gyiorum]MCW2448976.1 hypothetical protein [Kerstersia gyiorum]